METQWTILPPSNIGITTEPDTASDKTESLLRALIFSGQLGPGDKLPSERELAAQLKTSRPTLRTALRALEALGFVMVRIGSKGGFWINDAETINRRWHDWMRANKHQLDEMLDFRRWVEVEIARQALHDALGAAAHNKYLEHAMATIRGELFAPVDTRPTVQRVDDVVEVHVPVVAAVCAGDSRQAVAEMTLLVDRAEAPFRE